MKLNIIGLGRLGAPYAAGMLLLGHDVLGLDTDPETVAKMGRGEAPFTEPKFTEALRAGVGDGMLRTTQSYTELVDHAKIHFIAVPTPSEPDSDRHDLSYLFDVVDYLGAAISEDCLVVVKSSVPAGTTRKVAERLAELVPAGVKAEVAASPDFMREGRAVFDVHRPGRIVLGVQSEGNAEKVLRELWADCLDHGTALVVTDWATAELSKLAANAYLATRVSYANALSAFCDAAGADPDDLVRAVGLDERIGTHYLAPGVGYGGSCIGKDTRGLAARAAELDAVEFARLLAEVSTVNDSRRERAVRLTREAVGGELTGTKVGVWGAAFKPGVDDIRDSPALDIAARLAELGAAVTVFDPMATNEAHQHYPQLTYALDAGHAAKDCRVLLHLTDWPQFARIDPEALEPARSPVLIDGRPGLDREQWAAAGWQVVRV